MYVPHGNQALPDTIGLSEFKQVSIARESYDLVLWQKEASEGVNTYIVFFHGNGGTLHNRKKLFQELTQSGEGLVAISYPGYGASGGEPSEITIYDAAQESIEFLKKNGISVSNMIFYGESLGTAVAAEMATKYTPKVLILQSPFTNMVDAAFHHYPYVIGMKYLVLDHYDTISKVDSINTKTIVIHGRNDRVVPFKMGQEVFDALKEPKASLFIDQIGHAGFDYNHIYNKYIR